VSIVSVDVADQASGLDVLTVYVVVPLVGIWRHAQNDRTVLSKTSREYIPHMLMCSGDDTSI
jgi:hypothetical protein